MHACDKIDLKILTLLQKNARITMTELAEEDQLASNPAEAY